MPCRKRFHFLLVGMLLCEVSCATVDQRAPPAPPLGGETPSGSAPIDARADVLTAAHSEPFQATVLPAPATQKPCPYDEPAFPSGTDANDASLPPSAETGPPVTLQGAPLEPTDRPLPINFASALRLA